VPGVYELEVGSRLFDAVVAAGGFMDDADQASVNLARPLSDGEQVIILKLGDQSNNVGSRSGANEQISLNRASESELESLPGVGPALANRIIDWRTANGGFKRKEDLLQVGGIGSKLFASLEKLVSL
jgi:competence protein ComEA